MSGMSALDIRERINQIHIAASLEVAGPTDEVQLATLMQDLLDDLKDLALGNRTPSRVVARKDPAPAEMTHCPSCGATVSWCIDQYVCDGCGDEYYVETLGETP